MWHGGACARLRGLFKMAFLLLLMLRSQKNECRNQILRSTLEIFITKQLGIAVVFLSRRCAAGTARPRSGTAARNKHPS